MCRPLGSFNATDKQVETVEVVEFWGVPFHSGEKFYGCHVQFYIGMGGVCGNVSGEKDKCVFHEWESGEAVVGAKGLVSGQGTGVITSGGWCNG